MASASPFPPPSPATPQHTLPSPLSPSLTTIKRSYTLPTRLIDPSRTSPQINHAPDTIETLLYLDFAKVVAFDAAVPSSRPSSSAGPSVDCAEAGIPWATPSERTLAAGSLRIYRVPNTGVSFLNSGSFLKPILQRTQCWCVDDESKFVLRVREGTFYRVELPCSTQHEKDLVEELKKTLDKLCRYEKTPCPFKKGYVELEERPLTPVRTHSLASREKAKRWRLNKVWEPEDADRRAEFEERNRRASEQWKPVALKPVQRPHRPYRVGSDSVTLNSQRASTFATDRPSPLAFFRQLSQEHPNVSPVDASPKPSKSQQPSMLRPNHTTVQADDALQLQSDNAVPISSDILDTVPDNHDDDDSLFSHDFDVETSSITSSRDSFFSMDDEVELETPKRPPALNLFKSPLHSRDSSIATLTPGTPRAFAPLQEPSTPTLTEDSSTSSQTGTSTALTPPSTIRQRRPIEQLSIIEPQSSNPQSLIPKQTKLTIPLSAAIIRKTYALLLGPPTHLVSLMLSIAARILNTIPGSRRQRHIPGAWDTSDEEHEDDDNGWDTEDDYGYPLSTISTTSSRFEDAHDEPRNLDSHDWDID